ncbi:MAG: pyridoxal phosphate-dependent aminotransferase [Bacteroidales bacterium]|nr:pyridoxal phosphate-dependent aminotransferase [Bacteroidales bacterium]
MCDTFLSKYAQQCGKPSPVNEMTKGFASDFREGIDINLGVGYVNDDTIPAELIATAFKEVINDPLTYRNALNYGGADGSPALKTAIKKYYIDNAIGGLTEVDFTKIAISIGANGATSILNAFADIFSPGIVITADPMYYIYCNTLVRKGFDVVTVPEDNDGIQTDLLKELLEKIDISRLRFLYIVTVNNPSCTILSNARKEIVKLIAEIKLNIMFLFRLFLIRAYEDIIHNQELEPRISALSFDDNNVVFEVGTFSKIIAPALRIGYVLSKNIKILNLLDQVVSDIGFSAPLINQEITAWLLTHYIKTQLQFVNSAYREKAFVLSEFLNATLEHRLINMYGGDAGFYFYMTLCVPTHRNLLFYKFLSRTTGNV